MSLLFWARASILRRSRKKNSFPLPLFHPASSTWKQTYLVHYFIFPFDGNAGRITRRTGLLLLDLGGAPRIWGSAHKFSPSMEAKISLRLTRKSSCTANRLILTGARRSSEDMRFCLRILAYNGGGSNGLLIFPSINTQVSFRGE